MKRRRVLVTAVRIQRSIVLLRGRRVMLDADLAAVYGVSTKRLNEQVGRNEDRFPRDFMFQLTAKEKAEVVANCDHLRSLKFSPVLPHAFTEHGAIMLAGVLNSPKAITTSVYVVRAFVQLREFLSTHRKVISRLTELERRAGKHDVDIRTIVEAIRQLLTNPDPPVRQIGFRIGEPRHGYDARRET